MFKKLLLLFNGIFILAISVAQKPYSPVLLASGGNFFQINNSYSLSYTIGEMSVKTLSRGNYMLTEGFQQGKPHYPIPAIKDIICMPNPVDEDHNLTMLFYENEGLSFTVQIFDISGRKVDIYEFDNVLSGERHDINFKRYAKGLFLVKVQSKDGNTQRTFKIEKI